MGSKFKIILFAILGLVLLVQFTNCAELNEGSSELSSSLTCSAGELCTGLQPGALSMTVSENTTISRFNNSSKEVLVVGKCATGNYSSHKIEISYARGSEPRSNLRTFFDVCQQGKYHIRLFLETGDALTDGDVVHIKAQIFGLDGGQTVESKNSAVLASYYYPRSF